MTLADKFLTALSNLGRRKVRSVLTSLGVCVGTLTIVLMISLALGVRERVNEQFEKIGLDRVRVEPPGEGENGFDFFGFEARTKLITQTDVERWRKWPGVVAANPEIELPREQDASLVIGGKSTRVFVTGEGGISRRNFFAEPPRALAGSLELPKQAQQRDVNPRSAKERFSIVVSHGALKELKVPRDRYKTLPGKNVEIVLRTSRGDKQRFTFRVQGVSSQEVPFVEVPTTARLAMKSWWYNDPDILKNEGYDVVFLRAPDVGAARELTQRVHKEGFEVQSIELLLDTANRIFSIVTVMLGLIGGLTLFVASIGIANTMIMAIYERTREIGMFKAMGASRGDIRLMFTIEAGLIGLIGGTLGLLGGWALGLILNRAVAWFSQRRDLPLEGPLFVVSPELALGTLIFAVLIGVIAGLYPAHRAAKLDPLAALRQE